MLGQGKVKVKFLSIKYQITYLLTASREFDKLDENYLNARPRKCADQCGSTETVGDGVMGCWECEI